MAEKYIQTAIRVGWLLQELESELTAVNDGFVVDPLFVRNGARKRLPTPDEIVTAINALTDLRVLRREGTTFYLNKQYFRDTEEFRAGVWQTIETLKSEHGEANRVSLCVATPPGIDPELASRICRDAGELRSAILDIVASAKSELILASPFWDEETTTDVEQLLEKRLDAGVTVTLLGRFNEPDFALIASILRRLASHPRCSVLSWFSPAQGDKNIQTFHFKAAVADQGTKAYLGSANLTTSGLRSRMELGVILTGEVARQLHRVVVAALALASPAF
jgi:phosphatidylserine/phosphatidylglycerophosphate/cardiolipin synthase-like enzyme